MNSTSLLYVTAASIGLVHTLLGPDHYLPFIAMARARNWSLTRTMIITVLCGVGHVLSSVAIGAIGIVFGVAVLKLESVESFRSELTGYMMIGFGLIYLVWGIRHALRNKPHSHWHVHTDGSVHTHEHTHTNEHLHIHDYEASTPNRDATVRERENYELQITNYEENAETSNSDREATVRERETSTYQNVETTSFPPYQGGTEGGQDEFDSKMESTHLNPDREGARFDPNPDHEGGATFPNRAREEAAKESKPRVPLTGCHAQAHAGMQNVEHRVPLAAGPPVHHSGNQKVESSTLTPWILFTIFLFGPCELLIPVLMYPAAAADIWSVVGVTLVFGFTTITTMSAIVAVAHVSMNRVFSPRLKRAHADEFAHGLRHSNASAHSADHAPDLAHVPRPSFMQRVTRSPLFQRLSQYSHALAGFVILLCGTAMMLGW